MQIIIKPLSLAVLFVYNIYNEYRIVTSLLSTLIYLIRGSDCTIFRNFTSFLIFGPFGLSYCSADLQDVGSYLIYGKVNGVPSGT